MARVLALIDGEHYPPVVRAALEVLGRDHEVVAAAFLGGTEKVGAAADDASYGVPVVRGETPEAALKEALRRYEPGLVVDLSDEPVITAAMRFRLAGIALAERAEYRGADFHFSPPRRLVATRTPAIGIIGTGKRVGKTAISAYVARHLKAAGRDIAVVAMGRGGPAEPELIRGEEVELTTADLLALARRGVHAASDNYEDAIMSRVTTVGARRCGGGLAGDTFFSNVVDAALLADSLGKELLIFEGSGAAIPPAETDANILVIGAGRGLTYVRDYFGPYRLGLADLAIIACAEEPVASMQDVDDIRAEIARVSPGLPVIATTFRPAPVNPVCGSRVFFATTAPSSVIPMLASYLESTYGCEVVGTSPNLSDRALLQGDLRAAEGTFDLLLTELKAAAIDVVAQAGESSGVETVLCDNVPVPVDGADLPRALDALCARAIERGLERASEDVRAKGRRDS